MRYSDVPTEMGSVKQTHAFDRVMGDTGYGDILWWTDSDLVIALVIRRVVQDHKVGTSKVLILIILLR
jgi:hypothetical protein